MEKLLMRISGWSMSRWSGSKGKPTHQSDDASNALTFPGAESRDLLCNGFE
jgi:hypothetical protein